MGCEIGRGAVEHLDRSPRMTHKSLSLTFHGKDLCRARHRRELDDGLSDLAVSSEHQDDIALAHTACLTQSLIGSDERHSDCARRP